MPRQRTTVAPIPQGWLDAVILLLKEGDDEKILWTAGAQGGMADGGLRFKTEAYDLCLGVLQNSAMLGEQILDMVDEIDGTICQTWAFLCPNPFGPPHPPLYAKIGLHEGRLHINFISLHTDRSGKLLKAMKAYYKEKK